MLAWMGVSAVWQHRSFWTAENLMATVFYGAMRHPPRIRVQHGRAASALYLLIYSLLGRGCSRRALRARFTGLGTLLLGVLFSVGWYYPVVSRCSAKP